MSVFRQSKICFGPLCLFLMAILVFMMFCSHESPAAKIPTVFYLPYDRPSESVMQIKDISFICQPASLPPLQNLIYGSVYKQSDPKRATVDKKAKHIYQEETGPSQRLENAMLRMSNEYWRSGYAPKAKCVLDWLYELSEMNALLGHTNDMGIIVRQWMLASFSSAYGQIRDEPDLDKAKRKRVRAWLKNCANAVMADYPRDATEGRKSNNHLYWAAWSVTMTGIALNQKNLYNWGIGRAKKVLLDQFSEDGTIPLEIARGRKALQYHVFSALPLVMLAEAGARNGDDLYVLRDGMMHTFIMRIMEGLNDTAYIAEMAGAKQASAAALHPGHFAWMEPYNRRFPMPAMEEWLHGHRPIFLRRTGGNMTMLYSQ